MKFWNAYIAVIRASSVTSVFIWTYLLTLPDGSNIMRVAAVVMIFIIVGNAISAEKKVKEWKEKWPDGPQTMP